MTPRDWFKDHQRVLVYPPGAGGEYITAVLNSQDLTADFSFSKRAPGRNRYSSHNSFPGHSILFEEAQNLPQTPGEWTDECRLNFKNEMEIKRFLKEQDPKGHWKQLTGNPDVDKVIREKPGKGEYETVNTVFVHDAKWFPTHYDYNCFREPVWKWLDYDNPYWTVHWSMCIFFKGDSPVQEGTVDIAELSHEWYSDLPEQSWHPERNIYRNYYNQKYPNSRINVDDLEFRDKTRYINWAEDNLKAMNKYLVDNDRLDSMNQDCWRYLNEEMPR